MIVGKAQDVVSAAVVIGAAEKAAGTKSQSADTGQTMSAEDIARMQDEWNNNPNALMEDAQEKTHEFTEEGVAEMTDELNELMDKINCNLEFQYHKEVGVMSVKMLDKHTGEVIKEFPPEEMIENMINARDWIGAFLDKNA